MNTGRMMFELAERLWPINRSLTGHGVRETLNILKEKIPALRLYNVPTGTTVFDWEIPKEWRVRDAYIIDPAGNKLCQYHLNNLHLVGYSTPVRAVLPLDELENHLYSLPDQPDAIPYVTSYYKQHWGFCLCHNQRVGLADGDYQVVIDSELIDGHLNYGELLIPGQTSREIFLSTYICHPSMANNELSGPVVAVALAEWLLEITRFYSYRIVFVPETIGSITYLSHNLDLLKKHVIAGFNLSCLGDDRAYSFLPSRNGATLSDDVARHVLRHLDPNFRQYSWSDRGSDERQYCSPGIDLPIASIMRSKYGTYPEYHTSLDRLGEVVTVSGLEGGYLALKHAICAVERNIYPLVNVLCEPQMGKRGLYPNLSTKTSGSDVALMMNLLTWSDGQHSLLQIADLCGCPIWDLYPLVDLLSDHNLITVNRRSPRASQ